MEGASVIAVHGQGEAEWLLSSTSVGVALSYLFYTMGSVLVFI